MRKKRIAFVFLTIVAVALLGIPLPRATVVLAAPGAGPLFQGPPPPPPPPDDTPTEVPDEGGGGGGGGGGDERHGGGSRFPHCNSSVDGLVTNYGDHLPGNGSMVEVGGAGWKEQVAADTNGYFRVDGLCPGTAYAKVIIPPGALPTNPNAEAALDGKNRVTFDMGFFPPPPMASLTGGETPLSIVTTGSIPQTAPLPAPVAPAIAPKPAIAAKPVPLQLTGQGLLLELSAPQTVRAGTSAPVNIAVKNTGPGKVAHTALNMPLAAGLIVQEASTSRGALKIQVAPDSPSVKGAGLNAPMQPKPSTLVVDIGALAPGEAVLVATQIKFREDMTPGSTAELRAEAAAEGKSYSSRPVTIGLTEAGGPFVATYLPTTGTNQYRQFVHNLLW